MTCINLIDGTNPVHWTYTSRKRRRSVAYSYTVCLCLLAQRLAFCSPWKMVDSHSPWGERHISPLSLPEQIVSLIGFRSQGRKGEFNCLNLDFWLFQPQSLTWDHVETSVSGMFLSLVFSVNWLRLCSQHVTACEDNLGAQLLCDMSRRWVSASASQGLYFAPHFYMVQAFTGPFIYRRL